MDDDERFSRLKDLHRACLELLLRHYQIKEIAQKLGISVSAVNQRLERARRMLGAPNSYAAARMLADYDRRRGIWIPPTGYENAVPEVGPTPPDDPATTAEESPDERLADGGYGTASLAMPTATGIVVKWPFPTTGRSENDLNAASRMAWVLPIAILSMGLLMVVGLLAIGAQDVVAKLQHSIARLH
jgi:DNA-binding CsgD family transcriptional regulator